MLRSMKSEIFCYDDCVSVQGRKTYFRGLIFEIFTMTLMINRDFVSGRIKRSFFFVGPDTCQTLILHTFEITFSKFRFIPETRWFDCKIYQIHLRFDDFGIWKWSAKTFLCFRYWYLACNFIFLIFFLFSNWLNFEQNFIIQNKKNLNSYSIFEKNF